MDCEPKLESSNLSSLSSKLSRNMGGVAQWDSMSTQYLKVFSLNLTDALGLALELDGSWCSAS